MALTITHPFVSPIVDELEADIVGPDEWNAAHTINGILPAANGGYQRIIVTSDYDIYVRTDGNDSNSGLVDNAGGAFLTLQRAVDYVEQTLDLNLDSSNQVTIHMADGTYSGTVLCGNIWGNPEDQPFVAVRCVNVEGNISNPQNVVLTGVNPVTVSGSLSKWKFNGVKAVPTNAFGAGFFCQNFAYLVLDQIHITIGAAAHQTCFGCFSSAKVVMENGADLTVAGNGDQLLFAGFDAAVDFQVDSVTLVGTPAYSAATVVSTDGSMVLWFSSLVTGTATGARYFVAGASAIDTFGSGTSIIPGDSAGSAVAADGGFYL